MDIPSPPFSAHPVISPSLPDSAIDIGNTKNDNDDQEPDTISERLFHLADLASTFHPSSHEATAPSRNYDSTAIHQHLDIVEEILRNRHQHEEAAHSNPKRPARIAAKDSADLRQDLSVLLRDLTAVTGAMQQRRGDLFHTNALVVAKCETLRNRILELEVEVKDLQGDLLEHEVEVEGLRGMVGALENWLAGWKEQRASQKSGRGSSSKKPQRKKSKAVDAREEDDNDLLIEGINAWMRGWKDAEDAFRIRSRMRAERRKRRKT
ncbi:hypothetical protein AJ80_01765 [Polytolypa hystricis UAMH7299]|uniref:Uncharacterized protein n=1 Tax=Polytolypa hystricis (strain UAMH7299) TaxID=1447883 RepID=A0A2B7YY80_POLH7|nr:hypothetical protein AJ80_01765 [Polytolypa hystricis UAMH7299]